MAAVNWIDGIFLSTGARCSSLRLCWIAAQPALRQILTGIYSAVIVMLIVAVLVTGNMVLGRPPLPPEGSWIERQFTALERRVEEHEREQQKRDNQVTRNEAAIEYNRAAIAAYNALRLDQRLIVVEGQLSAILTLLWMILGTLTLLIGEAFVRFVRNRK